MNKQAWRVAIGQRRRSQDPAWLAQWSQAIVGHVAALPAFQRAATLLAYWPLPGEVDIRPVLAAAVSAGKTVALPRIVRWNGVVPALWPGPVYGSGTRWLGLHQYDGDPGHLCTGPLGIMEPDPAAPCVPVDDLDLVLVPGVAFDRQGTRLGHGAGYYDRLLALVPGRTFLAGLAFGFQIVDALPRDTHDHPVQAVVWEEGVVAIGT